MTDQEQLQEENIGQGFEALVGEDTADQPRMQMVQGSSKHIAMSQEKYEEFKKDVLNQTTIARLDVNSSDITFDNLQGVSIQGTLVKLEKKALTSLTSALGLSKMFIDTISKSFGDNKNVLAMIIKAVKSTKAKKFTFVYNKKSMSIVHVYPAGQKLISDSQYFETLEKVLARTPGAFLRQIHQKANGDLEATLANPRLEFDFNKFAEEVFTAGMTLSLNTKKMYTAFFTERLWCTNGCVNVDKLCTVSVESKDKVPDFMAAILDADYHINSIAEFKKRLNRCYHTTASLGEVLATERSLRLILGENALADSLLGEMSARHIKEAFNAKSHAYMENTAIHKFLNTDLTLWELVNEMTAVSSAIEQRGLPITQDQNMRIQIVGGDRMFRIPDLAPNNIKQVFK